MAYPEPIPIVKGKDARKFEEKLKDFSLTEDQVKKYSKAKQNYS